MTDEECRLMLELYEKYNNALKNNLRNFNLRMEILWILN